MFGALERDVMKTTIAIDDELFAKAQEYAGVTEKSAVVRTALKAFVQVKPRAGLPVLVGQNLTPRPLRDGVLDDDFRSHVDLDGCATGVSCCGSLAVARR
jgi:Arc/MetJ family transcription regulator